MVRSPKQQIQIVIFDVDGTLIDESGSLESQTDQVTWKFGDSHFERQRVVDAFFRANDRAQRLKDEGRSNRKGDISWYMQQIGEELNIPISGVEADRLARDWSDAYSNSHNNPRLFPDALNTLKTLQRLGYRLIVASGNTVKTRETLLSGVGVRQYFEAIHAAIDMGFQKQDVRFWTSLIDTLGIEPEYMAVVGNQVNDDIMHPVSLGMTACLIRREDKLVKNLGPDWVEPTHRITTLSQLGQILQAK